MLISPPWLGPERQRDCSGHFPPAVGQAAGRGFLLRAGLVEEQMFWDSQWLLPPAPHLKQEGIFLPPSVGGPGVAPGGKLHGSVGPLGS